MPDASDSELPTDSEPEYFRFALILRLFAPEIDTAVCAGVTRRKKTLNLLAGSNSDGDATWNGAKNSEPDASIAREKTH